MHPHAPDGNRHKDKEAGDDSKQGSGTMVYQTEMMALNIYNTFYANQNSRGVGQAEGVIFFVIVVIIALIQLYFTRRKEVQQ